MSANRSSWQDAEVARRFLDERRAAIPYAADQLRILLELVGHFLGEPRRVLDLGCGDGLLARTVLARHPGASAVLLDHSPPMLERARRAMADFADRCRILPAELAEPLDPALGEFDLVVSGFAIHHLPTERKRALYGEIFARLTPGGLFVHIEHVASATPRGEALFDQLYIDHIAPPTGRPRAEVAREYHARPDKADNKLESLERQLAWLREAGFAEVDCFFKWFELAVFSAQRPK
jgi:ubiquinone/menaquinone biosynthesis C-methylase UbiE